MPYFLTIACLLAAPDCVWSYDCMRSTQDLVNTCIDECYVEFEWDAVRRECNEAERLCERDRFFACFEGPKPQAWHCEPVASDGTLDCTNQARRECEEFDYDKDGDVDLYDWGRFPLDQWCPLRG